MNAATLGADDAAALVRNAALFALLCARLFPLCAVAPWLAVRRPPVAMTGALTIGLSLCLWPAAAAAGPAAFAPSWSAFALFATRELLLGLIYALALALPLLAFEWAGVFAGRFAGGALAEPGYAQLQLVLACAVFFTLGGARVAIGTLADAVTRQPLGTLARFADPLAFALSSVRLLADAFAAALLIALPVAIALLLAELALAFAARASSNAALVLAAAPARAALALLVVCLGTRLLLELMPASFERGLSAAARLLLGS